MQLELHTLIAELSGPKKFSSHLHHTNLCLCMLEIDTCLKDTKNIVNTYGPCW